MTMQRARVPAQTRHGRRRLSTVALAAALATPGIGIATGSTAAHAAAAVDVRLNVLVLDDGSAWVGALTHRMDVEGTAYTRLNLNDASRPALTETMLATTDATGLHAQYSGVILPTATPNGMSGDELALLRSYERTFKVREVAAYNWPSPAIGLNWPTYSGSVDGVTAQATAAARADAFSYLTGPVAFDDISPGVIESYGYLATPSGDATVGTMTPLVTAPMPGGGEGVLIGAFSTSDGREQLVMTYAANDSQAQSRILDHGILRWLTRGMSTSMSRNYLSVHIDDIFLSDQVWSIPGHCTYGDAACTAAGYDPNAPEANVRMVPSDVSRLTNWQNQTGVKLDMTFNAFGSVDWARTYGSDPLKTALLGVKSSLRWINHTYDHAYLGCEQDWTVTPWQCVTVGGVTQWVSQAAIATEITDNTKWARTNTLPNYSAKELVTGEHSGLQTLPQMPSDNPNLGLALTQTGITWVASDASREPSPRRIGSATTVPRHPMNIYYNAATKAQETAEYNWIYTSAESGGSGMCTAYPEIMTCITPLDVNTGFDTYIAPTEARIGLGHVLDNNPRPHYAHQSNLAADGILYPVLDRMIASYQGTFASNAPLVNPTMTAAGTQLVNQQSWAAAGAGVAATVKGTTVTLRNTSAASVLAPLTLPNGSKKGASAFGAAYGGERSSWVPIAAGASSNYTLASASGFATTATWPAQATVAVLTTRQPTGGTTRVRMPSGGDVLFTQFGTTSTTTRKSNPGRSTHQPYRPTPR